MRYIHLWHRARQHILIPKWLNWSVASHPQNIFPLDPHHVLAVWLDFGTKTLWLGLGRHRGLVEITTCYVTSVTLGPVLCSFEQTVLPHPPPYVDLLLFTLLHLTCSFAVVMIIITMDTGSCCLEIWIWVAVSSKVQPVLRWTQYEWDYFNSLPHSNSSFIAINNNCSRFAATAH